MRSGQPPNPVVYRALAAAFTCGEPSVEAIVARAERTLGRSFRRVRTLAIRYLATFSPGDRRAQPRVAEVIQFLRADRRFADILRRRTPLRVHDWMAPEPTMQPVLAARAWLLPQLATEGELARWLGLSLAELAWFADTRSLARYAADEPLRHYRYRLVAKRHGGARLIESPKPYLKSVQRRLLDELLTHIPAHAAAHGFVSGRSIQSFAAPHTGQLAVLRMDLRDFFPSVTAARVATLFRTAGYPERVAESLAGLSTNHAPYARLRGLCSQLAGADPLLARQLRLVYSRSHLPQGAPTSPALANLCFYRTDCRLAGLARAAGAVYTRYADDLAFSGGAGFRRSALDFAAQVAAIVQEGGFAVNHRKTRLMQQGVRQQLAGLVVNERVNVPRAELDRLKATLTNCIRFGPEQQNRDHRPDFRAHLAGRIAYVTSINAARGARLAGLFAAIAWQSGAPTE